MGDTITRVLFLGTNPYSEKICTCTKRDVSLVLSHMDTKPDYSLLMCTHGVVIVYK